MNKQGEIFTVQESRRTKQLELLSPTGEVAQKVCLDCCKVKLISNFPRYTEGNYRPRCYDCNREHHREYSQSIENKRVASKQNFRASEKGLPHNLTEQDIIELKVFADGRCMLTGMKVEKLEIDHVQPLSHDWLGSTPGNIILVSPQVNNKKHKKSLLEFLDSGLSEGFVDKEQLKKTIQYLAGKNDMSPAQYIGFLRNCEELARRNKEYWQAI
ncbi:hypothetical protein M1K46_07975 [Fictibacillus sp. WQ 8-8]|uniref:HNH endonuclease n=1 Tax=Fictibacillus sp. WQ 8-8 TaxID=2938788 RepID=UPI00210D4E45|nr:HNH endonuclease [Fictibacillus sp. WQ 8-8]MCQ6265600.1 hypothetical protein [Fictibacillus sp. WQ 8-8]